VPTLATVAAAAGVSRQTVSNALNNPELLRQDTLDRVREAVERLGYSPNRAARSLRTRTSRLVGLRVAPAVEGSASALMDRFVHSLVEGTKDSGYHVLLFAAGDADDPVDGYDELLRSQAVDAFVVPDTFLGNPQAAWLERRGVPFVAFGRPWAEPDALHPWVDVDGRAGVMLAVDHLVERGHSRVAWVGFQKGSYIGEDRRGGWTDRMHPDRQRAAIRVRLCQRHGRDGRAGRSRGPRSASGKRRRGRRVRRLHRRAGLDAAADLGAAAAGAGGRRDRPVPGRAARPPADPRAGLHPDPDAERGADLVVLSSRARRR
jgi:DNA-binding LacI/PurR family transcriptional regulator